MKVELLSYMPRDKLSNELRDFKISDEKLLPHLSFTFAVEGISRACSHQLVRHRVASFSQKSQRFLEVKELEESVIIPKKVLENASQLFTSFIKLSGKRYAELLKKGIPKEDARFILPNATETSLLVTMDGRALLHFFGLRCCLRAQWEIRALADEMLYTVRTIEPKLFRKAGPYCYQLGYCPEGRFSCGKMKEVVEQYSSLEEY